ncbi:Mitochondrial import inner membrane translocase subunit TIM44 [Portunus trituberculatus]|uniref:Mitochondrial import inner membrane translocase subunit TIM44 n=1 Tax=Portunus trituberculatus TaxID=210409 RepID=A0A5B7DW64_PORTR|nr:Mitochondrial import inner membrane translocase subunit TIM44 [Portunus trituberculatus]
MVLDVDNVDLVMGKVMEEGPVLAVSFQSQQIMCLRNKKGEVVEGDPSKVLRVQYVWVLCRDQTELDSRAAWRILDLSAQSTEQLV